MTELDNKNSPSDDGDWLLDDGRVISANGEELFTMHFLPSVGRLILTRRFKSRLSAATPVMRRLTGRSPRDGQTPYVSRQPAKARNKLLCYNIHNDLRIAGTLTLSEWPDGVEKPLQLYIDRLQDSRPASFPWMAVAEIGGLGQPHWHICLPGDFEIEELVDRWEASSITNFQYLSTNDDLVRWSLYMAKHFEMKMSERLTYRRYHAAHGFHPKPIRKERVTREEAYQIAVEQAALHGSDLAEWNGPDAWCPKGYFWDV